MICYRIPENELWIKHYLIIDNSNYYYQLWNITQKEFIIDCFYTSKEKIIYNGTLYYFKNEAPVNSFDKEEENMKILLSDLKDNTKIQINPEIFLTFKQKALRKFIKKKLFL